MWLCQLIVAEPDLSSSPVYAAFSLISVELQKSAPYLKTMSTPPEGRAEKPEALFEPRTLPIEQLVVLFAHSIVEANDFAIKELLLSQ